MPLLFLKGGLSARLCFPLPAGVSLFLSASNALPSPSSDHFGSVKAFESLHIIHSPLISHSPGGLNSGAGQRIKLLPLLWGYGKDESHDDSLDF